VLQGMSRGAGPVGYYPKVLKGVLLTGRFVSRFWILVPGSSFWVFYCWPFCSWVLVPGVLVSGILVPGAIGREATDSCLYWLTGYGLRVAGLGI
jgi:hypothetical protein